MIPFISKSAHSPLTPKKIALSLAIITLLTACNQQPKTDANKDANKDLATQTTAATSSTTTTTIVETASSVAPMSDVAPTAVTPATSATVPTAAMVASGAAPTAPIAISPEKAGLAKDLVAFNNAINATSLKSQKLQADFIQKHKANKSPDVQVLFIKEGIKSLDQQKTDLQAVKLTDPKVIAMRDKFVSTIEQQKSVYTFMANTPKPTQAQQEDVGKKMANIQKSSEESQQIFLKLAQEAGLQPQGASQAGKAN